MPGLARTSWALALYAYPDEAPAATVFADFFDRMERLMADLGLPPTHVSAAGDGYRDSLTGWPETYSKYRSRVMDRLRGTSFAGITAVGLTATAAGSDASSECYAVADLDWAEWNGELRLLLTVNEGVLGLESPAFRDVLLDLLAWRSWSFGHGLRDSTKKEPLARIWGVKGGREGVVWEEAGPLVRQCTARGIFPLLVLNEQQLRNPTRSRSRLGGLWHRSARSVVDLRRLIERAEGTRSEQVGDLLVWWIPPPRLGSIRRQLRNTEAVLPSKPWGYYNWGEGAGQAPPPATPQDTEPNPARDALWEMIRAQVAQAPDVVPIVPFSAFFEGNDEEDTIAPNQAGYGRPPLAEMYRALREVAARPDVEAVLVSMHDDALHWLKEGETGHWPEAESVHIITSAPEDEVKRWLEEFDCDDVCEDPTYSAHPAAPEPRPGYRVFTVFWD